MSFSNDSFELYLNSLNPSSKVAYQNRVSDYQEFCNETSRNDQGPHSLTQFLCMLRDDEDYEYASSTLWTIESMVSKWFKMVHNKTPLEADPVLKTLLKQWQKQDTKKKASIFSKEDLLNVLKNYPDDNGGNCH